MEKLNVDLSLVNMGMMCLGKSESYKQSRIKTTNHINLYETQIRIVRQT